MKYNEYPTLDEHICFIEENNLTNSKKYQEKYKECELKLHSNPWFFFNYTETEFFEMIFGEKKEYAPAKEHEDFIKKERIFGSVVYGRKYTECDKILHSSPWNKFGNRSQKDYFDNIWAEFKATEKQHKDFIIKNELNAIKKYQKAIIDTKLIYEYEPWIVFGNGDSRDYFDKIWENEYANEEEHINFIKNDEMTPTDYKRNYKKSKLRLYRNPWKVFGYTQKQFFDKIYGRKDKGLRLNEEKHEKFVIVNDIRTSKKFTEERLKSDLNLYSNPWVIFGNGSVVDYFHKIWENYKKYQSVVLGEFSKMNKLWGTSNSKTTHARLKDNNEEWHTYHKLYREARKLWDEIPYIEIAKKINVRPDWVVADLGCGENLLAKEIGNKIYSFDHVAIDDSVIQADISNIPLESNSVDVVVLSLALMGSNRDEYIKEAYRILRPYGNIFISEPYNKWEDKETTLVSILEDIGFKCFPQKTTEKFIYVDGTKII